jgi:Fic family protein
VEKVFAEPALVGHDAAVAAEIEAMRRELSTVLRAPRRWQGTLRRAAQAKAIQGSNSIEGYKVSDGDAAAAVDDEPALTADERTWAEVLAYRRVLTYVLNVATDPRFTLDENVIRSMHFMLLEHDLSKSPGRYRGGPVYVTSGQGTAYTAPDADRVPELVAALVARLGQSSADCLVRAAMAHLNLVMIHPFRDGNGRMGRALQTLVLAQDRVLEPAFASIEEWLGANTADYYSVLAATGAGSWHPERSADLWLRFNLRAHHMQAQTVRRRFEEASRQWALLDELVAAHGLPERVTDLLFDALLGWRVARPSYVARAGLDERTATRDLVRLTDLELLTAHGQTKGRHYTAGPVLQDARTAIRAQRRPITDPYPDLIATIRAAEAEAVEQSDASPLF